MKNTFSLLFYPKGSMVDKALKVPIYLRITINGKRCINRKVELSRWNQEAGKLRGTTKISKELNHYIDTIWHKIYQKKNLSSN